MAVPDYINRAYFDYGKVVYGAGEANNNHFTLYTAPVAKHALITHIYLSMISGSSLYGGISIWSSAPALLHWLSYFRMSDKGIPTISTPLIPSYYLYSGYSIRLYSSHVALWTNGGFVGYEFDDQ